jgi:hypothetical protein
MGLMDTITDAVGLTGGDKPPEKPVDVKWVQGETLANGGDGEMGAMAPGGVHNNLDTGEAIEFIHYGYCHPDWHTNFEQSAIDDTQFPDLDAKKGRGVLFRAALLREVICTHGMLIACQQMVKDYDDSKGALGDLMSLGSSLLGGGSSGPPKPSADDFNKWLDRVSAAGGKMNQSPVSYADVHKTGIELHTVRAEYAQYVAERVKPDTSQGFIPPLPGGLDFIPKVSMKMMDIYLQTYLSLRQEVEPEIAEQSYGIGIKQIKERTVPVFPVWSPFPKPEAAGAQGDSGNLLQGVNDQIQKGTDWVNQRMDEVRDFLGMKTNNPAPGQGNLSAVFAKLQNGPDWIWQSWKTVVPSTPDFWGIVVKEVTRANAQVLQAAYVRLMDKPGQPIDPDLLVAAGRHAITTRVIEVLAGDMVKSLTSGGGVQGIAANFAASRITGLLDDNVTSQIDFIIQDAVGNLAAQINDTGSSYGSPVTMEAWLGHLPAWLAEMTRNITMPLWGLVIGRLFGGITSAIGPYLDMGSSALSSVKSNVEKGKHAYDQAKKLTDKPLSVGTDNAGDVAKFLNDPAGSASDYFFGSDSGGEKGAAFPGSPRVATAAAKEVTEEEATAVQPHKYDSVQAVPAPVAA